MIANEFYNIFFIYFTLLLKLLQKEQLAAKKREIEQFNCFQNLVEWIGNKRPHPITLFSFINSVTLR